MAKKNARGGGTIRKKTVTRSGREYTYWESRLTVGRDPGTGKQLQRSFTGKTQKEVREKMQAAAVEVNQGTYTAPQRLTVGQWLYIWAADYLGPLKPCTVRTYRGAVRNHIAPGLGAVRLVELHPHMVQEFVNGLELAPGFVRLVFQVLHTALEKAVDLDYIPRNPAARCELPRRDRREMFPLDDGQLTALLDAARGRSLEPLVTVALFTGLRQSELLGLTWNAVDFERGTVTVDKQLSRTEHRAGGLFTSPKSGKARVVMAAPSALAALRHQRARQAEAQLRAGPVWANPHRLVFTTALGGPLDQRNVDYQFKRIAAAAGLEGVRFHDTRHPYVKSTTKNIYSKIAGVPDNQPSTPIVYYTIVCPSKVYPKLFPSTYFIPLPVHHHGGHLVRVHQAVEANVVQRGFLVTAHIVGVVQAAIPNYIGRAIGVL